MDKTCRSAGFTLIELMVIIAIVGLLALITVPLTAAWVNDTKAADARTKLTQAFRRAKALALRNPAGATGGSAASSLVYDSSNELLRVCSGAMSTCTSSSASMAWQIKLFPNVGFTYLSSSSAKPQVLVSLAFDNTGSVTPLVTQFVASKADQNETFSLR